MSSKWRTIGTQSRSAERVFKMLSIHGAPANSRVYLITVDLDCLLSMSRTHLLLILRDCEASQEHTRRDETKGLD